MMWNNCFIRLAVVFLLIGLSPVIGITRSSCPIACECVGNSQNQVTVKCNSGHWNEIPSIPKNSTRLRLQNGHFGTLRKPKDCTGYDSLVTLVLVKNKISTIAVDAFSCMPELISMNLNQNLLKVILPGTFSTLSKLKSLELNENKLTTEVFHEIAMLELLSDLKISRNNMVFTGGSLNLLERCVKLAKLEISGNIINDTFRSVIEPVNRVRELTASSCGISSLDDNTFGGFTDLYQLSMGNNDLKFVSNLTFSNLTSLRIVDFSGSLREAGLGWLDHIPPLLTVTLRGNHLTDIPQVADSVTELYLDGNNFKYIGMDSFAGLRYLRKLSFPGAHVEAIHSQAFADNPNLIKLDVRQNNLQEDGFVNVSTSLANSSVQQLLLSTIYISTVTRKMFSKLTPNQILILEMKDCGIERIESNSFENFRHLKQLSLHSNKLTKLERGTFHGLHSLEELYLISNSLYYFPDVPSGLNSLIVLSLGDNSISGLGGKFHGRNLRKLTLAKNKITKLSSKQFSETPALEELLISENDISFLKHGTFSYLANITKVDFKRNRLSSHTLLSSGFGDMTKLEDLDFSYNTAVCSSSQTIKSVLRTLINIKRFILTRCSLEYLLPNMFVSNMQLEVASLADNRISYLEPTAFCNATNLHTLFLQGNSIRFVNFESFINLPALRELQLSNNPLLCTCEVLFILQAVRTNLLYMGSGGLEGMRCDTPIADRGKTLEQIHMDLGDCEDSWTGILIPITSCCGSLIAAFMVFISWRYRWHLKYLWFIVKAGRRRLFELHDDTEYEYDAFIAYSAKDLWWVKEQLLPNLDEQSKRDGGFRFCLHHRDWLAGVDIVDNIVTSIERSRRTIIVLSDHFATSQWCQYELAMAQLRLDADGTSRELLVVVLLSNISAENLTPRLRFLLTTKSYLSWSENPDEQILFWKALRRSLGKVPPLQL